ncbi:MAG: pilus assembly protein PilM [Bdellovibrionaceae bacterium]|nr:pilus assembly protein PilM [Pseudobdellovibrionaceae bacterium]
MRSVGIDIGTHQVKVVEVQSTSKGFQLVRSHTKKMSRATGTDHNLEVIEFLREIAGTYDPKSTRFCVSLRQDQVAIRNKTFPFTDRLRIQKALPFELEEELPFSLDNAVFEGKIIRTVGNTAEVLAGASPKTHVANLLQLMKDSSIEPHVVSTEGTAFANLFERWWDGVPSTPATPLELDPEARPPRLIRVVLNIGHTRTLVSAFEGDSLVGVRSLLWGGKNIIDAISQKYNLPPAEAQKEMEVKAFILTTRQDASYEAKVFSDLIAKQVRDLVHSLQLSLLEFRSEFNGQITEVQMTGGVSAIQGLGPFLTQHLEAPVNRLQVLDLFPNVFFERSPEANLTFGIAIGLALDGLRKPRNPAMNFMKGEFARQSSFAKDLWTEYGGLTKTLLVASVLLAIWAYGRTLIATHLDEVSGDLLRNQARSIAKLPSRNANEAGVKRYIRENRKKIADIRTIESLANMNSAMEVLSKISAAVPDGKSLPLDVSELSVNDGQARLAGFVGGGQEMVNQLSRALSSLATDGKVTVENTQPAVGRTGFRLNFRVDRNIQKVGKE